MQAGFSLKKKKKIKPNWFTEKFLMGHWNVKKYQPLHSWERCVLSPAHSLDTSIRRWGSCVTRQSWTCWACGRWPWFSPPWWSMYGFLSVQSPVHGDGGLLSGTIPAPQKAPMNIALLTFSSSIWKHRKILSILSVHHFLQNKWCLAAYTLCHYPPPPDFPNRGNF